MFSRDDETIVAQCTPSGNGALALIRLSGINAREIVSGLSICTSGKKINDVPTHTVHVGWVLGNNQEHIDQVLFLVMHGPRTFTGQDTIEITCHNNPFIIEAIITRAIAHGARIAQAGEFTKRAYLNKKIDLVQAEAINELINAHTQEALNKSLAQLEGSFSHWIATVQDGLLQALTLCEASFEFLEEDINFDDQIKDLITQTLADIQTAQEQYQHQQQIKEGVRVALIGSVNAGKSSLFNALINKERAIVTEIAGTTRDTIEASVYKNNGYFTFIDTAGLRQTHDQIEQEGIKRSIQEADKADVVLLVIDSSTPLSTQEELAYRDLFAQYAQKTIVVATKHDIQKYGPVLEAPCVTVSSTTGYNIEPLMHAIIKKTEVLTQQCALPFLINKRQHQLLHELKKNLLQLQDITQQTIEYELVSIHLHDALEKLTELTGKTISELSLDAIFKNFCVGK